MCPLGKALLTLRGIAGVSPDVARTDTGSPVFPEKSLCNVPLLVPASTAIAAFSGNISAAHNCQRSRRQAAEAK